MDFAKGAIWNSLQAEQPEASRRYNRLRKIMDEIIDWRDAALHRAAPLVVTKLGRDPQTNICHIIGYEMADEPEPDPVKVFSHDKSLNWVDPLHFHNKWRPSLLQLCEETCRDIEAVWYEKLLVGREAGGCLLRLSSGSLWSLPFGHGPRWSTSGRWSPCDEHSQ